jgi:hypothetical protein
MVGEAAGAERKGDGTHGIPQLIGRPGFAGSHVDV